LVSGKSSPKACSAVLLTPALLASEATVALVSDPWPLVDFVLLGMGGPAPSVAEMSRLFIGLSSKAAVLGSD
jgi:hypothetical protein